MYDATIKTPPSEEDTDEPMTAGERLMYMGLQRGPNSTEADDECEIQFGSLGISDEPVGGELSVPVGRDAPSQPLKCRTSRCFRSGW